MYIAELNHPMFDQFDLSSLRTGIIAGAAVPPEIIREAMERMNMKQITNCYGLTETSPVFIQTAWNDTDDHKVNTIGRPHAPVEVRVIDPNDGHICGPNEIGELCCKGYNVMKGYYKMPEATAGAIDADGFLHSGDLGAFDEQGYYTVTGRIKDMIIRGGENIYPLEIENFLLSLPGVLDAQVVGSPDQKYGEIVVAFVKQREGFELSEAGIREHSLKQMARYKVPKYVFFVDEYPETTSKKVQKFKLREVAEELVAQRLAQ
jgi:fatty-acyl-CoA synthase